jgi:predicted transcriptional regulator
MSKRVTVYFDEETVRKLKALVRESGKPAREIIKDAMAQFSARHPDPADAPVTPLAAKGRRTRTPDE